MSADDPSQPASSGSYPEIDTRRSFLEGLPGLRIADRYKVVRILGEGGMGVVAEARHLELEQSVAIKFMFPEFLSNEVLNARFSREAKLAAKVQSPHIVRVSDVGRLPSGVPYLVMDLLAGHDLAAELDEHGTLPVERAVDYVLQACAGIAALHAIGVVHRDLKPSNLFVADVSGAPTVKVLDFGISKDVTAPAASITSTDTQLGTPMYMSPEQIRASKNVDTRSDIWSLGVILYELLTGTLPFERSGHSVGELFAVILMTDPMPLCMRRPELPAALEEVVMRCLRRGSWDRYENVAELAEALRPFARAGSIHRIDTVRRALGEAAATSEALAARAAMAEHATVSANAALPNETPLGPPPRAGPPEVAVASPPPPRERGGGSGERALDQGADVKLEIDYVPTPAPARARAGMREPHTSPSLVTSSRASPPGEPPGTSVRAGLVWGFGIAAAIIGAAATFAIRATSTPPPPVDPSPALASPQPAPLEPERSPAPATPVPWEAASQGALAPRGTAAPGHPSVAATVTPRPVLARPTASVAPAGPAPAAKPRTESDLIQDRK